MTTNDDINMSTDKMVTLIIPRKVYLKAMILLNAFQETPEDMTQIHHTIFLKAVETVLRGIDHNIEDNQDNFHEEEEE